MKRTRVAAGVVAFATAAALAIGGGGARGAVTCSLVPQLRDVTINQGLGSDAPLAWGKETLVRLYLSQPSCASTGALIQVTGGTLAVSGGGVPARTVLSSTPTPAPTYPAVATYNAAAAVDSTGDPKFVVPASTLSPAGTTAGFTAAFTATITYQAQPNSRTAFTTGSVTFTTMPGSTTAIGKAVAAQTHPLRVLVVPMGDPKQPYSTELTSAGQTEIQRGMSTLSRIYPVRDQIDTLAGTAGGGIRYSVSPTLLDLSALMPNGKFCGTTIAFTTVRALLAQFLQAWNSANPTTPADRVLGVVDESISNGSAFGCDEGRAAINGNEAWVRLLYTAQPSMTGALMAMELCHTMGCVPTSRNDGAWHSLYTNADYLAGDLNRGYNLSTRSVLPTANDHTVMRLATPWNNTNTILEKADWALVLCRLGGPVTSDCTTSGDVGSAGAAPSFVMSGTTDGSHGLSPGSVGSATGTNVVESYFSASVPQTQPDASSPYRLIEKVNAAPAPAPFGNQGVPVTISDSHHAQSPTDESDAHPALFSIALPFSTGADRIELWKGQPDAPGSLLLYARNTGPAPVVTSTSTTSGSPILLFAASRQSTSGGPVRGKVGSVSSGSAVRSPVRHSADRRRKSRLAGRPLPRIQTPLVLLVAQTFTVNSTGDASDNNPGDSVCNDAQRQCTLRAAIQEANANAGADTIDFGIGTGAVTIQPASALPTITDAVTIDGTSQPGYTDHPLVELNGSSVGAGASGLSINATGTTVKGLSIGAFGGAGIDATGGVTVTGSYIGVAPDGATALPNGNSGIALSGSGSTIGGTAAGDRNVVSGNTSGGIRSASGGNNTIEGNYIGTNAAGTAAIANGNFGVSLIGSNNTVGGTAAGAGNVISGTVVHDQGNGDGIQISAVAATGNLIQGNFIGTDAAGSTAIPNALRGININGASTTTVGGTTAAARNVISGNGNGISIGNGAGTGNVVEGNYIGLAADGTTALGNGFGIQIFAGSGNTIGGTAAGAGNVISANQGQGIVINGSGANQANQNVVQGNLIGTDAGGTQNRGNGSVGVTIDGSANTVGGLTAGAANTIAFNGEGGVVVASGTGNGVLGNSIFGNTGTPGLGIDLAGNGVTVNDSDDADTGANNLQNFPVISTATLGGGTLHVQGSLDTNPGLTNAAFRIEVFQNATCDPSGNGEGQTLAGAFDVTVDASGHTAFDQSIATNDTGTAITATATAAAAGTGDTSEFSACVQTSGGGGGGGDPAQTGPIFTVNTADDHSDTSGCTVGDCSLREAIDAANSQSNGDGPDHISFAISGSGSQQISVIGSPLPSIIDPVVIDGDTETGTATGVPTGWKAIVLNGDGAGTAEGLVLAAGSGGSEIKGLAVRDFAGFGLDVQSNVNTIDGNYIGLGADGLTPAPNKGGGVQIVGNDNIVGGTTAAERNVIAANGLIDTTTSQLVVTGNDNVVNGNYIGVGSNGTTELNAVTGVTLQGQGGGNTIGGDKSVGNIILGYQGIEVQSAGNTVAGNDIGLDASGAVHLESALPGIHVATTTGTVIGDSATPPASANPSNGNVIVGRTGDAAVFVEGSTGTRIAGNFLGTNRSGSTGMGNNDGVRLTGGGNNTVGPGNEIARNSLYGVEVGSPTNRIVANSIHDNGDLGIHVDTASVTITAPTLTSALKPGATTTVSGAFSGAPNSQFFIEFFNNAQCDSSGAGEGRSYIGFASATTNGAGSASYSFSSSAPALGDVITATATNAVELSTSQFSVCKTVVADAAQSGQTVTVNTNADHSDAGGCTVSDCTLREAIDAANTNPGTDTISFGIGTGAQTIRPITPLPAVTDTAVIDATTQPGFNTATHKPIIELDGSLDATYGSPGLRISAGASTVRGFVINRFQGDGVVLDTAGGDVIAGNYIGTDATGASVAGNTFYGVDVFSSGNTVGGTSAGDGNVISGNNSGININGLPVSADNNTVEGNKIGVAASGAAALGNLGYGVVIDGASGNVVGGATDSARNVISGNPSGGVFVDEGGSQDNTVQGNYIGTNAIGTASLAAATGTGAGVEICCGFSDNAVSNNKVLGNLVSGNSGDGVYILGDGTVSNVVQGNLIGINALGTAAVPNAGDGIHLDGSTSGNTIGGSSPGAGNVVSGNGLRGIEINSAGSNTVQGNYVGTNAAGTGVLSNGGYGVFVTGPSTGNTIGSTTSSGGNVISGNHDGIRITNGPTGTLVQGNRIGTSADGSSVLGQLGAGVVISNASSNSIGGTATGAGNVIAGSNDRGVFVSPFGGPATGNAIEGNSIHDNSGLGIDLEPPAGAITPNDLGDADTGANHLQNFPVIQSAQTTFVAGDLNSVPSGTYRVELFVNTTCDASGNGEGARYLGSTTTTTGATGNGSFTFTPAPALTVGQFVTATATDSSGSTSEFSACKQVVAAVPAGQTEFDVGATDDNPQLDLLDVYLDCGPGKGKFPIALALPPSGFSGTVANWSYNYDSSLACAGGKLEAVVNDGFKQSGFTDTGTQPVNPTQKAPLVSIVSPVSGKTFLQYASIPLRGAGFDAEDGKLTNLQWKLIRSSNNVPVATASGDSADLSPPAGGWAAGAYTVQLSATDSAHNTSTTASSITIVVDADNDGIPASAETGCLAGGDSDPMNAYGDADGDGIPNGEDAQPCSAQTGPYTAIATFSPNPLPLTSSGNIVNINIQIPYRNLSQVLTGSVAITSIGGTTIAGNLVNFKNVSWKVSNNVGQALFDRPSLFSYLVSHNIHNQTVLIGVSGRSSGPPWSFQGFATTFVQG